MGPKYLEGCEERGSGCDEDKIGGNASRLRGLHLVLRPRLEKSSGQANPIMSKKLQKNGR